MIQTPPISSNSVPAGESAPITTALSTTVSQKSARRWEYYTPNYDRAKGLANKDAASDSAVVAFAKKGAFLTGAALYTIPESVLNVFKLLANLALLVANTVHRLLNRSVTAVEVTPPRSEPEEGQATATVAVTEQPLAPPVTEQPLAPPVTEQPLAPPVTEQLLVTEQPLAPPVTEQLPYTGGPTLENDEKIQIEEEDEVSSESGDEGEVEGTEASPEIEENRPLEGTQQKKIPAARRPWGETLLGVATATKNRFVGLFTCKRGNCPTPTRV